MKALCAIGISILFLGLIMPGQLLANPAYPAYRADGQNILDPSGAPFLSRGIAVSGWLFPEAYMLRLKDKYNRHLDTWDVMSWNIADNILKNQEDADKFWQTY